MSKPEPPSKEEFKARLKKAQQQQEETSWNRSDLTVERNSTAGRAWRLSVEMVAALLVCGWFGWLLDKWLDTKPWLMLVFLIVGAVVGLYNVIKVGKRMNDSANED
ncbi:AtpZ/AtpI family protein [Sneathiella sp. CAU 1612]|uniref:ATP synthase protein I n=1 Tax=Sneathiella sedimenti TaxID=2816034 RepID=A0ABS3F116_9PROT|nr:AtpZ/AtpI family protein [Sneathiella sedimenti]MBO0332189.1 AtpZ/AtpI family protein [Sneathiella sedimenti]